MAKTMTKRKTKAKALPRHSRTGIAAAPTDSFHWFATYLRMDVDKKDIALVLKDYIKANYTGKERTLLLSGPDYMYGGEPGVAATIAWKNLGHEWDPKWNGTKHIETYIARLRAIGEQKKEIKQETTSVASKDYSYLWDPKWNGSKHIKTYVDRVKANTDDERAVVPIKRPPMEIVKEKSSDFIACIEEIIDMFGTGDMFVDWKNYSVYNEMIKADLNAVSAKHVLDYYTPLLNEMNELVNDKPEDLVEAYSHWSIPQRKQFLKLVSGIVDDAEKYLMSKKATRAPKKTRVKSADKQITKLNFLKDSGEFKLKSINPSLIVGATRLYTFNVKTRMLTEYITERSAGFEVKGSSLHGIDADRSRGIRLRKPEEHLTVFLTKTPTVINKLWGTLTTKTIDNVNGRINKDTIILRVLDK